MSPLSSARLVTTAREPDANAVMNAAMAGPWRIIHIAGHGAEPVAVGSRIDPRGVVLSDNTFLGPREIGALRVIPELVFVNCCHLATGDVSQLLKETNYDRAKFASGVAEALINKGVRCVVAAGWAVNDEAARVFATTFYARLLDGSTFIDAVAAAREESRGCGGNTWAAYQCYGDPDWKYRRGTGDAQRPTAPDPSQELAGIASAAGLVLTLQTLAVKSEFEGADATEQAERLRYLEEEFEQYWRNKGEVAEAFGNAWSKIGRFDEAIDWYTRARVAPDGASSLAAVEQLANLKVRRAWEQVAKTDAKDSAAREHARKEIAEAMALLDMLLDGRAHRRARDAVWFGLQAPRAHRSSCGTGTRRSGERSDLEDEGPLCGGGKDRAQVRRGRPQGGGEGVLPGYELDCRTTRPRSGHARSDGAGR